MRDAHRKLPFHRIEAWQHGASIESIITKNFLPAAPPHFGFFRRSSLYDTGLQVGLGHEGDICPRTSPSHCFDLNVLDVSGQHTIRFRDCFCDSRERWKLLLGCQIFPATETDPKTGFTFHVLEHQQSSNLRGKTSLHEYYQTLIQLSGTAEEHARGSIPNIYDQFRHVVRQFRVLSMLMRAGRTNTDTPLAPGELCVQCPACPYPGVNLPENWDKDPLK
ncbi:hypothetical protein M407DRAFT_87168 [Tulasnella calospora MUT 4182]|uniref:CxC2-like cysteine cluster KDZ transposase-associated domain-containing protein n=1 Tax=Tulasnella calospora MUT 4182 TaxID=1051891 RepID=A0A0C3L0Y7_9AGAM|nr:hypothetical protein M407DRAFT_87202 [Tulasnella calospora MUT 4182]KIO15377.1 hypothetical protein M407DRAFT_87168 [Tulasnella calospora MUT 4182]